MTFVQLTKEDGSPILVNSAHVVTIIPRGKADPGLGSLLRFAEGPNLGVLERFEDLTANSPFGAASVAQSEPETEPAY